MPQPGQAVILRLHRNVVGQLFPWDCVYFFQRSDEAILPQVFPCSLVINTSTTFMRKLKRAYSSPAADRGLDQAFPMHRWEEEDAAARVRRQPPMEKIFTDPNKYIALIPTLHLRGKYGKVSQSGPVYITAKMRRGRKRTKGKFAAVNTDVQTTRFLHLMGNTVTAKAYFIHRGEKIQPVCLCCPNSLDHLDGRCHFGSDLCYQQLVQATASDFISGLATYKQLTHALDTEITDEQLHRNEG